MTQIDAIITEIQDEDFISTVDANAEAAIAMEYCLEDMKSTLENIYEVLSESVAIQRESLKSAAAAASLARQDALEQARESKSSGAVMGDFLGRKESAGKVGENEKGGGGGILSILGGAASGIGGAALGVGAGVGLAGAGIGAAAGGFALLINQIKGLMTSFDEMADGIAKLNSLEIDITKFATLGYAISEITSGAGIGGAIGLKILSGVAFEDLAKGIQTLNETEFDPSALENVGKAIAGIAGGSGIKDSIGLLLFTMVDFQDIADGITSLSNLDLGDDFLDKMKTVGKGIDALLSPLSAGDIGEATVLSMIDDNLSIVIDAAKKANSLTLGDDFLDRMTMLGEGLDALLSPLSAGDIGAATVLQMIDDNLPAIANGVTRLNEIDAKLFSIQGALLGLGFGALLDGLDDLLGATGMQMIDDNLSAVADGVKYFTGVVTPEVAEAFKLQSVVLGEGFQTLLDGTDDLFGATGMQMIDDNIIPVAQAVRDFTTILNMEQATKFRTIASILGDGFRLLMQGTGNLFEGTRMQSINANLKSMSDSITNINDGFEGGESVSTVGGVTSAGQATTRMLGDTSSSGMLRSSANNQGAAIVSSAPSKPILTENLEQVTVENQAAKVAPAPSIIAPNNSNVNNSTNVNQTVAMPMPTSNDMSDKYASAFGAR